MEGLQNIIPPKMYDVLERAGVCTPKEIVTLSSWDIKKITNMTNDDISLLKNMVATHYCPPVLSANKLKDEPKLVTGCHLINKLLNGGLRKGTITEIFGESGTGKTQFALQIVAQSEIEGAIYICTEDAFPIKRFNQLQKNIDGSVINSPNVHIEQITEASDLIACVKVRMQKLLEKTTISLIVIDSIAAPFRFDSTNYIQRAENLRDVAVSLQNTAQKYNLAVICINQVTSSFVEYEEVLPSLGLTWSNMISYRVFLKRTKVYKKYSDCDYCVREIGVIYSPDIVNKTLKFIITGNGIEVLNNEHL